MIFLLSESNFFHSFLVTILEKAFKNIFRTNLMGCGQAVGMLWLTCGVSKNVDFNVGLIWFRIFWNAQITQHQKIDFLNNFFAKKWQVQGRWSKTVVAPMNPYVWVVMYQPEIHGRPSGMTQNHGRPPLPRTRRRTRRSSWEQLEWVGRPLRTWSNVYYLT